jgi:hypothetical protein
VRGGRGRRRPKTACARGDAGEVRAAAAPAAGGTLFTRMPAAYTGVRFANAVRDTRELNVFTYRHFYNGGGVAVGDLTGDGRPELFFTGSQVGNRLYVNDGSFRFRDVTAAAGVGRPEDWATGVSMADVNGDGRLDVYVCYAGKEPGARRRNALYINTGPGPDGVPRLVDSAAAYGVADEGTGTQAAWLDYDHDGDLDLFLVNNSPRAVSTIAIRPVRDVRDTIPGNRLFRNDVGPDGARRFTDVSAAAGLHGNEIAFGLGVAVTDVNRDGWPDVYVANDFFERDYLYLNRGDGTFAERLDRHAPVLSYFSMGMDAADVDNDGWPDVYTTDMLPEDEGRLKGTSAYESWDVYQTKVIHGYGHQLMRNMLQRNGGDWGLPRGADSSAGSFTEIAQMAGAARTDWSWGAVIADLDLDGRKDVFVTNGLARDITSQDYVAFMANEQTMREVTKAGPGKVDFLRLTQAMDSTPIANYAFRNVPTPSGGLRLANDARAWGLDVPSFSSGAAYGDLDGDGAVDLVVNNVDGEAFVYRNNARSLHRDRHALRVRLEGEGPNRFAVGARVTAYAGASGSCRSCRRRAASSRASTTCSPSGSARAPRPTRSSSTGPTAAARRSAPRRPTGSSSCARPAPRPPAPRPRARRARPPARPRAPSSRTPRRAPRSRSPTARTRSSTSTASGCSPRCCRPRARRSPWATSTATGSTTSTSVAPRSSRARSSYSAPAAGSPRPIRASSSRTRRPRTWARCSSTPTATATSTCTS